MLNATSHSVTLKNFILGLCGISVMTSRLTASEKKGDSNYIKTGTPSSSSRRKKNKLGDTERLIGIGVGM